MGVRFDSTGRVEGGGDSDVLLCGFVKQNGAGLSFSCIIPCDWTLHAKAGVYSTNAVTTNVIVVNYGG